MQVHSHYRRLWGWGTHTSFSYSSPLSPPMAFIDSSMLLSRPCNTQEHVDAIVHKLHLCTYASQNTTKFGVINFLIQWS